MHIRNMWISLATLAGIALAATSTGAQEIVLKSATALPGPLLYVRGAWPSRMNTDLPSALWPLTTRRISLPMCSDLPVDSVL